MISMMRSIAAIITVFVLVAVGSSADAKPDRTYHFLTTGNGHGFQFLDSRTHQLTAFLEQPYRYTRAPADVWDYGPERRNFLEDVRFGFVTDSPQWLHEAQWFKEADDVYLEQTNIIHSRALSPDALVTTDYFSPFALERNATVAMLSVAPKRQVSMPHEALLDLRFHLGDTPPGGDIFNAPLGIVRIPGERIYEVPESAAWIEAGHGRGAMVYLPIVPGAKLECLAQGNPATAPSLDLAPKAVSVCAGEEIGLRLHGAWAEQSFGVLIAYVDNPWAAVEEAHRLRAWLASRSPRDILHDSVAEWRAWRKPPPLNLRSHAERRLWRQSEAILRMAQVRERDAAKANNGMILASLAPGNWATGWVRDGVYATVALARAGYFTEARQSLRFFLNAHPVGKYRSYVSNVDYRVSLTRYFGTGEEEADYSGSSTPNIETDGWGLFLWAARQYLDASGDYLWLSEYTRSGTVYEALRDGVAYAIEQNLEAVPGGQVMKPDSSSWEVHWENRRHFAYTTIAAARGICDFASIARRAGHFSDAAKYAALAREIQSGLVSAFGASGTIRNTLEMDPGHEYDAAVVEAVALDVLPQPRGSLARQTITDVQTLRVPTGGYKRDNGSDPYASGDWVFIDLRMASAFRRLGDITSANAMIEHVAAKATEHYDQIPEIYNVNPLLAPLGSYAGSIPMVGYGSGAYILALLDREGHLELRDCGDNGHR